MIVLDFRPYGEELTLTKCAELYDEVANNDYEHSTIITFPDVCWITKWQADNIFSSSDNKWIGWRDIPLKVL